MADGFLAMARTGRPLARGKGRRDPKKNESTRREQVKLPNPRQLMLLSVVGMIILAATVVGVIVFAVHTIDSESVASEVARANVAVSVTMTAETAEDAALAQRLGHDFMLSGAHFTSMSSVPDDEVWVALPESDGIVLAWKPRLLGSELFVKVAPLRLFMCAVILGGLGLVIYRMYLMALELELRRQEAQELAARDALTGLSNRLAFDERMERAFVDRHPQFALLYIDLDGFKNVNDTLGHGAGDEVLRIVAERLRGFGAEGDMIARIGGDEFGILMTSRTSLEGLNELATDIAAALSEPLKIGKMDLAIGGSIGVARAPEDASSALELVRAADAALYRAKATNVGGHQFASELSSAGGRA